MKNNGVIALFKKAGLSLEKINQLSVQTGFIKRLRQIKAVEFLVYMIIESIRGCVSCNDLAAVIEAHTGTMASRQAYHQKMSCSCLLFFEAVATVIMNAKGSVSASLKFRRFKRILIQDSTVIKLPSKLMGVFSGVKNATTQVCNARVQSVFDLLCGSFVQWSIDAYSKNDQAAAPELRINAGDLILRDRGYFSICEFERMMKAGADFVSRYMHNVVFYDPQTGQEIDLLRLLEAHRNIDLNVLAGKDCKIPLRLIAVEVSQEIADRRRRKAREQCRGHNPSKDVLFLMGWTIFITSLTGSDLIVDDFIELYGLRWKIETIFKTWKSHLNFDKIHVVGEIQLRLVLTARFIAILLFYERIYTPLLQKLQPVCQKTLSLMKLIRYVSRNLKAIPQLLKAVSGCTKCLRIIGLYCTYDKRKRLNFIEKEIKILTIFDAMEILS
jgi:hypothetical protein